MGASVRVAVDAAAVAMLQTGLVLSRQRVLSQHEWRWLGLLDGA
jgi:hypothetical protein